MKIVILTNGAIENYDFYQPKFQSYDFIICADGGLKHAYKLGVLPNVALGDFDSTPKELLKYYHQKGCKVIQYDTVKDETDTQIALEYAINQKPQRIDIFAGIGSRFDHSLANVHLLLKGLDHNIPIRILTEHNEIMVTDSSLEVMGEQGDGISLLPLTKKVTTIHTSGLAYPIEGGVFNIGEPYGVSNYMSETKAKIEIASGLLLVMKYND